MTDAAPELQMVVARPASPHLFSVYFRSHRMIERVAAAKLGIKAHAQMLRHGCGGE